MNEEKPEPQENDPLFLAIEEVKIVLKKHDLLGWICLIKNNHGKYYGKNIFCLYIDGSCFTHKSFF